RRGNSDDIKLDLSADQLNLDKLTGSNGKKQDAAGGWQAIALDAPDKTVPRLTAKAWAAAVTYQGKSIKDLSLAGKLEPGAISLDDASLSYQGIPIQFSAALTPAGKGGRLKADMRLKEADFQGLVKALGSATSDLSGKINGGLDLTLQGATLGDGLKTASGAAVL